MPKITETPDAIEIHTTESYGARAFILLLSLFPLIAPYQLLIRPRWDSYFSLFFLFFALISAGAMALSATLMLAALAGLTIQMRFDKARRNFSYTTSAPLGRLRTRVYPFESVKNLVVETQDWSDSPPSYSLKVLTTDGQAYATPSDSSRQAVEDLKARIEALLGLAETG